MAIRYIGDKIFGRIKKDGKIIILSGDTLDELFNELKINLEAVK